MKIKLWDGYARVYRLVERFEPYSENISKIVKTILENIPGKKNVEILEIGSGTGYLMNKLLYHEGLKVTGVDISHRMKLIAQKLLEREHDSKNFELIEVDPHEPLPLKEDHFDFVILNNAFYAIRSTEKLLRDIQRVLRKNGLLIISDPKPSFSYFKYIKSHINSGSSSFSVLQVLELLLLTPLYLIFLIYNLVIEIKARKTNEFHFFESSELISALQTESFVIKTLDSSYAEQNHFIVATNEK